LHTRPRLGGEVRLRHDLAERALGRGNEVSMF